MSHYLNLVFIIIVFGLFFVGFGLPFLFSSHSDLGVAGGFAVCIFVVWFGSWLVLKQIEKIERVKNEKNNSSR